MSPPTMAANTHSSSMKLIATYKEGKIREKTFVEYQVYRLGRDWVMVISGGESHIGAVVFSDKKESSTPHYHELKTHKEGLVVEKAFTELSSLFAGELLVVGGIHYDDITKEQIAAILDNNNTIIEKIKVDSKKLKF